MIIAISTSAVSEQVQGKVVDKKRRKKRPLPTSGVEIFRGAKYVTYKLYPKNRSPLTGYAYIVYLLPLHRCVADLSRQQLIDWMRLNQPVLMNIFKRKEYSWRHEEFNTNPKMRGKNARAYHSLHHLPLPCPLLQLQ